MNAQTSRGDIRAFGGVSEASTQLPVLTGEAETQTTEMEDSGTPTGTLEGSTPDSDGGQGRRDVTRDGRHGSDVKCETEDDQRYENRDSLWEEELTMSAFSTSSHSKDRTMDAVGDLSRSEVSITRESDVSHPTTEKGNHDSARSIYRQLLGWDMLDQSAAELKATVEELEKRFEAIDNEGNEWKTRFETQEEMNQQLDRQVITLQNKVEEARRNLKEVKNSSSDNKTYDDLADANAMMVKQLDKEKHSLYNQLRDLEWRLDQESKAYHKANDERKQYVLEINTTKGNISELKRSIAGMSTGDSSSRTPRNLDGNIPNDQRILDPKKGPIRKTAGVKNLPSLEAA